MPAATFHHPGVLVSRGQLDFMRTRVIGGAQPWKSAYDAMMASRYASLTRVPKPRAVVECGSYSNPDLGCTDECQDAIAAYTLALASGADYSTAARLANHAGGVVVRKRGTACVSPPELLASLEHEGQV